jgi:phosphohistidine phosphatase SixA
MNGQRPVMRSPFRLFVSLLLLAPSAWCTVTVILTRHAEVAGTGRDPVLSAAGQARAQLLAGMLRDIPLDEVYVSDYRRTQQTGTPTADAHHLTPLKATEPAALAEAVKARTSGAILIVGHSNTVPQVVSLLGGPAYQIADDEFDNLFVLTINQGQVSAMRFRYGNRGASAQVIGPVGERTSIMELSFKKSGGIGGNIPGLRVQGTVNLQEQSPAVSGDASYRRELGAEETQALRAGAEPPVLEKAAKAIADYHAKAKGMGDVEEYTVSVKTSDGKTHDVTFNTSGSDDELKSLPPAAAKLVRWVRQEAQSILAEKFKAK